VNLEEVPNEPGVYVIILFRKTPDSREHYGIYDNSVRDLAGVMGINYSRIFPGLDGSARAARLRARLEMSGTGQTGSTV
jgi:hypothetical protein